MKKFILFIVMCFLSISIFAQAKITFKTPVINFGTFSSDSVQHADFIFTNTGDKPLTILQAFASCGCTTPKFTKDPIQPGEKGKISVKYDGRAQFAGHFKKPITIRSNATNNLVRIYIEGVMQDK